MFPGTLRHWGCLCTRAWPLLKEFFYNLDLVGPYHIFSCFLLGSLSGALILIAYVKSLGTCRALSLASVALLSVMVSRSLTS